MEKLIPILPQRRNLPHFIYNRWQVRILLLIGILVGTGCTRSGRHSDTLSSAPETPTKISLILPQLNTNKASINKAFRIALGDLAGNVQLYKNGLLDSEVPVIFAGLDYNRPWTRDAAINAWNGAALFMPDVAKNTLLSVLEQQGDSVRIGGQYWDAITWASGAWAYYLYTADEPFLSVAFRATRHSMEYLERTEFDTEDGLFRGPGWSDGIAAYPGKYGDAGGASGILSWPDAHPNEVAKTGYGIPMKALSTNCLYYNAYRVLVKMARVLDIPVEEGWTEKAQSLKQSINQHLWLNKQGYYRFFIGPFGEYDYQEALGHAYAILFGVADSQKAAQIFRNQHITPAGVPCVWPNVPRYEREGQMAFGRHSGTVWPQIQGFWATAAAASGRSDIFAHEFRTLTEHANRDGYFAEIYHPITGEIYGGLQEAGKRGIVEWNAARRQTWSATAYIRMVLQGLVGMEFTLGGIHFQPCIPQEISHIRLRNVRYRRMILDITIEGSGVTIDTMKINGDLAKNAILSQSGSGRKTIVITME